MPEGHVIHRAASKQNYYFKQKVLTISSPQGRFSRESKILDQNLCLKVEAFGKHLFYHFNSELFLHIHLGLFGRIRNQAAPPEDPKGQVRIRIMSDRHVVDITGPAICELQNKNYFQKSISKIGPDLLRTDAKPERFINRASQSRRPIGSLLMDQSVVAGIGNIFRTEILWRNRIHPETKGFFLSRAQLNDLWTEGQQLLHLAKNTNRIITTVFKKSNQTSENFNIYKKKTCPNCQTPIKVVKIENRKCYVCGNCQNITTS